MSRDEIPDVKGVIVVDGEVKDLTIKAEDICGDSSKSGKVVIVIKYQRESGGQEYTKMIYGKVR
ncbi:MAG: hypothetical protein K2K24_00295 [Clostridia bacterium]|nr:hypothetical protein [Clostridia bacterium]